MGKQEETTRGQGGKTHYKKKEKMKEKNSQTHQRTVQSTAGYNLTKKGLEAPRVAKEARSAGGR